MTRKKAEEEVQDPLKDLMEELRGEFGEGVISTYSTVGEIDKIPTGILSLDKTLKGGVPIGKMLELMGKPSSGKSTIALSIAASAQKKFPGKQVIYVDSEHGLDLNWAVKLGIDLSRFKHVETPSAEEGFNIIQRFLKSGKVCCIIQDSIPAAIPNAALEGEIGDANIGLQARLIAQVLPRLNSVLYQKEYRDCIIILINQKRANLQSRQGFGGFEPVKATGGMALPFYMHTRLDVARIGSVKEEEKEIGQQVQINVLKSRTCGPGHKIVFQIDNRSGIDTAKDLLDWAIDTGKVEKKGAWFIFESDKVQGEANAKEIIKSKYFEEYRKGYLNDAKESTPKEA